MTLPSLIERCEAATGPDRELDEAIVRALCPAAIIDFYCVGDEEKTVFHAEPLVVNKTTLPHYAASIDAALTLVPEGLYYVLGFGKTIEPEPLGAAGLKRPDSEDGDWICQSEAATVPLAICIAALRARLAMEGGA